MNFRSFTGTQTSEYCKRIVNNFETSFLHIITKSIGKMNYTTKFIYLHSSQKEMQLSMLRFFWRRVYKGATVVKGAPDAHPPLLESKFQVLKAEIVKPHMKAPPLKGNSWICHWTCMWRSHRPVRTCKYGLHTKIGSPPRQCGCQILSFWQHFDEFLTNLTYRNPLFIYALLKNLKSKT